MSTRTIGPVDSMWMWSHRRPKAMTPAQVVRRIRSDYLELPGLKLTLAQAARLWALSDEAAAAALEELTAAGFLTCRDGLYLRR